ncbi:MlaE family ABC transporter permease [Roseateles oligotrophus]|uniref:MlaE family ABC transporter permease n=1 Tax=Roseateles oligotrophus TaxID=1769250 RepID=UPI0021E38A85|nr:ABC transporter permease [Roseateles oligotrophus]
MSVETMAEAESAEQDSAAATPRIEHQPLESGPGLARLQGDWSLLPLRGNFETLSAQAAGLWREGTAWDLRSLRRLDNAGAMMLWDAWGQRLPAQIDWLPEHQAMFAKLDLPKLPVPRRGRMPAGVTAFGRDLLLMAEHLVGATRLLGQLAIDCWQMLRRPGLISWRDISINIYRTGAQAMGITALVGFLVGVTLSYLTSRQLRLFGADIYVINILGLSVWRELGPLLAAILVAGRSGSAMTAQLGVMRVTQELDALSVMGISHTIRLVLPKIFALGVAMPLVALWTSCMVLAGGMVAARATLGLDYVQFLQGIPAAVPEANLWLGLGKAHVFGLLIAFVACHFGLRIKPNSESLAIGTTSSVVSSITVVIIADAAFAIIFQGLGI